MDWLFFLMYRLYCCVAYIFWLCKRNVTYFYVVDNNGRQLSLTDRNLALHKTLLVIYYSPSFIKYRFHTISGFGDSEQIRQAYITFEEPEKYKLFAVNAIVHEQVHTINALEFNIVGNVLFTPTFKLWLCANYLHVSPTTNMSVSYIDDETTITTTEGPIYFYKNKMVVGHPKEAD